MKVFANGVTNAEKGDPDENVPGEFLAPNERPVHDVTHEDLQYEGDEHRGKAARDD